MVRRLAMKTILVVRKKCLGVSKKKSCSIDSGHDMSCRMYRRMDS